MISYLFNPDKVKKQQESCGQLTCRHYEVTPPIQKNSPLIKPQHVIYTLQFFVRIKLTRFVVQISDSEVLVSIFSSNHPFTCGSETFAHK